MQFRSAAGGGICRVGQSLFRRRLHAGAAGGTPGRHPGQDQAHLRVNSIDDPAVAYLRKVLIMFPGRGQIVFYAQDTQKRYGLPGLIHTSLVREARKCWARRMWW